MEFQPELRTITWDQRPYTVATPYVVMKFPFLGNTIHGSVEVFYRNEPLQSIDDQLCFTNLMNICHLGSTRAHLCISAIQSGFGGLSREKIMSEIVNHLWSGEFNRRHGYDRSYFKAENDSRLQSMSDWQKFSKEDPEFVLGVKWLPAITIRYLTEMHFSNYVGGSAPESTKHIGNLLLKAS